MLGIKSVEIGRQLGTPHIRLSLLRKLQEEFKMSLPRLLTFPNVVITGHQAFFTADALAAIAQTTLANLDSFEARGQALHPVSVDYLA